MNVLVIYGVCTVLAFFSLYSIWKSFDIVKKAETKLKVAEKDSEKIEDYLEKASKLKKDLEAELGKAKGIESNLTKQLKTHTETFGVMVVRVSIMFAIEELRLDTTENINERIKNVYDTVVNLSEKISQKTVIDLQTELKLLRKEVEEYRIRPIKKPSVDEGEDEDKKEKLLIKSRLLAVDRYNETLDKAIAHCNALKQD